MYYTIGGHSDPPSSLNAAIQAPGFLLLIPPPPTLFLLFATPIFLHHPLFPPTSCFPLFSVLSLQNNQSVGYKLTNKKVKKNQWIIKIIFSFTATSFQWTFGSRERKQVLFCFMWGCVGSCCCCCCFVVLCTQSKVSGMLGKHSITELQRGDFFFLFYLF